MPRSSRLEAELSCSNVFPEDGSNPWHCKDALVASLTRLLQPGMQRGPRIIAVGQAVTAEGWVALRVTAQAHPSSCATSLGKLCQAQAIRVTKELVGCALVCCGGCDTERSAAAARRLLWCAERQGAFSASAPCGLWFRFLKPFQCASSLTNPHRLAQVQGGAEEPAGAMRQAAALTLVMLTCFGKHWELLPGPGGCAQRPLSWPAITGYPCQRAAATLTA